MRRSQPPLPAIEEKLLRLILYTTAHCTLCEQALDMLLALPEVAGHELLVIDIANDEVLLSRYGEMIPVLRCFDLELTAPFAAADVIEFLHSALMVEQCPGRKPVER